MCTTLPSLPFFFLRFYFNSEGGLPERSHVCSACAGQERGIKAPGTGGHVGSHYMGATNQTLVL